MQLMQKYALDNGAVGIENLDRWPSDCDAVDFLSATTSASSVDDLIKVKSAFTSELYFLIWLARAPEASRT